MDIQPERSNEEKIKILSDHITEQLSFINSYTDTNNRLLRTLDALESRINHQVKLIEWLGMFTGQECDLPLRLQAEKYENLIKDILSRKEPTLEDLRNIHFP